MKKNIKLPDIFWGMSIDKVMKEAQALATPEQHCEFKFNGVMVVVSKSTNLDLLYRDYMNAHLMEWKTVGHQCVAEYPPKTLKEIEDRQKKSEEESRKCQEKYDRKEKEQKALFELKVVGVEMSVSNQELWDTCVEKNKDPYGKCAVDYARDWARLMQSEIGRGKKLEDIAEFSSHQLSFYGITGFMYGASVSMLSQCWEHGEALRKWHNKEYNHEGDGVVNPAILTIG